MSGRNPVVVVQTTVPTTLETFFKGQLLWLEQHGFEVHAVSSPGRPLLLVAERERVAVHAIPMSRSITPVGDFVSLWRLLRLFRRLRPTIVHGFTPKAGLLAMLAAGLARVPVRVYTVFGLPYTGSTGWRKRLMWTTEKLSCKLAHSVFCECESIRAVALRDRVTTASKSSVLAAWNWGTVAEMLSRIGEQPECRRRIRELLGIPQAALVAGFVGRIVPDKGIRELLQTQNTLAPEFPELHLMLVGEFEKDQPLGLAIFEKLRSTPRLLAVGLQRDVFPYLAAMDILLHPSYREGLPTVPMEAAALGLPVVTTNIPGCVDAVRDGETGILVPPRDSEALTRATRALLQDSQLRRKMGEAGRKWATQNCNPIATWEELLSRYKSACCGRALPPQ